MFNNWRGEFMDLLTFLRLHRAHKKSPLIKYFFLSYFFMWNGHWTFQSFCPIYTFNLWLTEKEAENPVLGLLFFFYNSHLYKISFILRIPILHTSRSTVLTFGFKKKDDTLVYWDCPRFIRYLRVIVLP